MQADFAVELGADDEILEIPWAAESGSPHYCDLKRHPELVADLEEVVRVPELGEFLAKINASPSALQTAKCDAWSTTEISPEEEIFEATNKFGSYVDLFFSHEPSRFRFPEHEHFARRLVQLLQRAPEMAAAADFLIRRCYYSDEDGIRDGFYITFYLFGYGNDDAHSRQRWAVALQLVRHAIRQVSTDLI